MKKLIFILFGLLYLNFQLLGQNQVSIRYFKSECFETLSDFDTSKITLEEFVVIDNKIKLQFVTDANCAQDKIGKAKIVEDSLIIYDNDILVEVSKRDSTTAEGRIIRIEERTETKQYALCTCRFRYNYEFPKKDYVFRYLIFNGRKIKF